MSPQTHNNINQVMFIVESDVPRSIGAVSSRGLLYTVAYTHKADTHIVSHIL